MPAKAKTTAKTAAKPRTRKPKAAAPAKPDLSNVEDVVKQVKVIADAIRALDHDLIETRTRYSLLAVERAERGLAQALIWPMAGDHYDQEG